MERFDKAILLDMLKLCIGKNTNSCYHKLLTHKRTWQNNLSGLRLHHGNLTFLFPLMGGEGGKKNNPWNVRVNGKLNDVFYHEKPETNGCAFRKPGKGEGPRKLQSYDELVKTGNAGRPTIYMNVSPGAAYSFDADTIGIQINVGDGENTSRTVDGFKIHRERRLCQQFEPKKVIHVTI